MSDFISSLLKFAFYSGFAFYMEFIRMKYEMFVEYSFCLSAQMKRDLRNERKEKHSVYLCVCKRF